MVLQFGGVAFWIAMCLACFSVKHSLGNDMQTQSYHTKLLSDLLSNYDKLVLPLVPVNVTYNLNINEINELDEKKGVLKISTGIHMWWDDNRLVWDPSYYNGIFKIRLPNRHLWQPDVGPYAQIWESEDYESLVYSSGNVSQFRRMRLSLPCNMQFTNYPFDSHTCRLSVESKTHTGEEITIAEYKSDPQSNVVDWSDYHMNELWDVQSVSGNLTKRMYVCCDEVFETLRYSITIKRRGNGYTVRVIAPSVITSLLIVVSFLVPASGERILFCSLLLVAMLVQLLFFNLTVPMHGANAPFLADFLCFSVFLAFFAGLASVMSLNLSHGLWGDKRNMKGAEEESRMAMMRIGRIIDFVCFIIFMFIFAVAGGVILNHHP